jgi:hypothetical protein
MIASTVLVADEIVKTYIRGNAASSTFTADAEELPSFSLFPLSWLLLFNHGIAVETNGNTL